MSDYTDPAKVTDVKLTEQPTYGRTASGYGPKIPTNYMIQYEGLWRRVYCMIYGNIGSTYVVVNGADVFTDTDTDYRLMALRDSTDPTIRQSTDASEVTV